MFRPAALIGIYNHGSTIASVVEPLRDLELPCYIVDDGSDAATKAHLAALSKRFDDIKIWTLPKNSGRGAALREGFRRLSSEGYSHAIVMDADGQHNAKDVPRFLEAARRHPDALVLGSPLFGADAPRARRWGRKISVFWVCIETLSTAIDDPLCGFRCYPVTGSHQILERGSVGMRMDFDPEMAVRLAWSGAPILNLPTMVRYPIDGISHFRMLRDNARISWMHTRLVVEMLLRVPKLLGQAGVRRIELRP